MNFPLVALVILLIIWFISGIGLILLVLLHSGKGTGLSDIIAGSVYNNTAGTSLMEKNLDRITVIFAVIFFLTLLILMLVYPQGTIATG
ncbi:MAG: preprotein translocase subunit SecG [Coriobacteriales bacterium]|jgi:preprotein translocase subunit SecG|nr:preprotein translocase subunit SecG [Coriobacteriales bacterium]